MKAKIQGIDVEGTVEEIANLIIEIDKNKKVSPPVTTYPNYHIVEYFPPVYVNPLPSIIPVNPIIHPQVWCDGFFGSGNVTCKQDSNVQTYN